MVDLEAEDSKTQRSTRFLEKSSTNRSHSFPKIIFLFLIKTTTTKNSLFILLIPTLKSFIAAVPLRKT